MSRQGGRRRGSGPGFDRPGVGAPAIRLESGALADAGQAWKQCGPAVAARQGWKLYVSATLLNFRDVLAAAAPVFDSFGIAYKHAANDKALRKLNAGLAGYSQVGKCIVAYLGEGDRAAALVPALKAALSGFRGQCPDVPFARPLGGRLPLFYRYGSYIGTRIDRGGAEREDDRTDFDLAVPEGIDDPFAGFAEPAPRDLRLDGFLTRYPVFEVISQGGKGGVFAALDIDRPVLTEVILKVGYRHGQMMPDGRDGFALLRAENDFFAALETAGLAALAPAKIAYREFEAKNALVMERLAGPDLMALHMEGSLGRGHVEACLAMLRRIHRAGLFVGDPKLANFVLDGEGGVRAVDFECGGRIGAGAFDLLRTFRLYNPEPQDLAVLDLAHFLFSVLYDATPGPSFSERDRLVDLRAVLRRPPPAAPAAAYALKELRALLG